MKLTALVVFLTTVVGTNAWVQRASGSASFTQYSGCGAPACGKTASGFTAAVNQLMFGASPGLGPGDACGRCFSVTATADPFSPAYMGPFHTIVVKVTDLCFDICGDTGGAGAFFPSGHGALIGNFQEVSCSQWSGSDGGSLFNGACLDGETAGNWPSTACGNQGTSP
ncbi:hypothetical protein AGABI1DRAFT_126178 [Agaricus bisporus var. burnettii JB137-S8]|uniref:Expansin-like EG45 domain-containing protein n=1 Tax=Agaricus bisporus var. burnettii (strain JB137-S8 / ATCC MYA-4627 / FGSC 10392) TaxID=597362 RepID=K5X1X8_AGABU|nr:uncharacterized protein AGABI1DRAFT_126178 [Agaricus bisporus var. burnettii JB137-S8]EKM81821.1 hypothetical protein AGABI1DRAFT_126178 [Agaricus bisporus var. burnettii JB137-S8]